MLFVKSNGINRYAFVHPLNPLRFNDVGPRGVCELGRGCLKPGETAVVVHSSSMAAESLCGGVCILGRVGGGSSSLCSSL